MRKRIYGLLMCIAMSGSVLYAVDSGGRAELSLVPAPEEVQLRHGGFRLTPKTRILVQYGYQTEDRIAAETLAEQIFDQTGMRIHIEGMKPKAKAQEGAIILARLQDARVRRFLAAKGLTADEIVGDQGYLLFSDKTHLIVAANTGQGIFYGVQTLRQLLHLATKSQLMCPAVAIRDWPTPDKRRDDQHMTRETTPAIQQPFPGPREY